RHTPATAEVRPALHLLGLPCTRVPEEPRHAHRPRLRQRVVPLPGAGLLRRPRGAQGQRRLGPCSRRAGHGPLADCVQQRVHCYWALLDPAPSVPSQTSVRTVASTRSSPPEEPSPATAPSAAGPSAASG